MTKVKVTTMVDVQRHAAAMLSVVLYELMREEDLSLPQLMEVRRLLRKTNDFLLDAQKAEIERLETEAQARQ